jgi:single-strand DNA-binding protein
MSGSVNKVILIGNLAADPESKAFSNGNKIVNMRLATSESWKDKATGERKERTEWHNVTINNDNLVPIAERFLRKGSKIYVEGALQTRKWQDRDGNDRYTTEIVLGRFNGVLTLLDGKTDDAPRNNGTPARNNRAPVDDDLDDCPF